MCVYVSPISPTHMCVYAQYMYVYVCMCVFACVCVCVWCLGSGLPADVNNMSIIHISLPELFDKFSCHHTQAKNIHLHSMHDTMMTTLCSNKFYIGFQVLLVGSSQAFVAELTMELFLLLVIRALQ